MVTKERFKYLKSMRYLRSKMKLEYTIKKPEDYPGEITNKEKYNMQLVPGKEVIIYNPYTGKPYDLSAFKKVTIGFKIDEKTRKNIGSK